LPEVPLRDQRREAARGAPLVVGGHGARSDRGDGRGRQVVAEPREPERFVRALVRPLATVALVLVVLAVLSSRPAPPPTAPLEPRALSALGGMLLALLLSHYLFTFRRPRFVRIATIVAAVAPLVALAFGAAPAVNAACLGVVWL